MFLFRRPTKMPAPDEALPGRARAMPITAPHFINGQPLTVAPPGSDVAIFAMGCFWGAEKLFWETPGVIVTSVGYAGGYTPNPDYGEVCSGRTGHAEVIRVTFDPARISYDELLRLFWENHDPTQGMRQGADAGTQYRSAILTLSDEQQAAAERSRDVYAAELRRAGFGEITTEILPAGPYYFAEDYHQQYLAKNPGGYCPDHATGVACPIGLGVKATS
jgi:peptide-methionine (S)-S-oxide reductase